MQLQLISSALNRIPAVNGNYYKELQGIGIIGSLKEKKKRGKRKGRTRSTLHPTVFKNGLTRKYTLMKAKPFNYFYKPQAIPKQCGRK